MPNVGVVAAIDRTWEAGEKGPRPHLGASVVGKPCDRMLVYSFRHAARKPFKGRMLRLFNRGHKEEHRICADLRAIGMEVREYAQRLVWHDLSATYGALEWEEIAGLQNGTLVDVTQHPEHVACAELAGVRLRQWSFSDVGGHHAGSTDGKARIPPTCIQDFDPALPRNAWFATEFKTYNKDSFAILRTKDSVRATKPEHYTQMQEYMHYMGLPCCLYLAVCKDNDEMYEEVVPYDEADALRAIERARMAIAARQLPPRIKGASAVSFGCKFCDYKTKCHFGETLLQGCRSCADAVAVVDRPGAVWYCSRWASDIPKRAIPAGCPSWRPITD